MVEDFEDIDLTDRDMIDAQVAEREAVIDRLHGEIQKLETARLSL